MIIYYLIGYLILFFVGIMLVIKKSPYGYEDENGFHYLNEKSIKN
ncbi:hypothetical protein [Rosettibacter firmus]